MEVWFEKIYCFRRLMMKKYSKLILVVARQCLLRILEFRSEVISWSLVSIVWITMMLASIELIFGQIQTIAGWNKEEVLLVVTIQGLFVSCLWLFVFPSLLYFSHSIRHGELDYFLLKPAKPRIMLSFSRFEFDQYLRIIVLLALAIRFVGQLHIAINLISLVGGIILFLVGLVIFYNLFFMITVISFWSIKLFNLEELFESILGIGKYPTDIFSKGVHFIFLYLVPIAFISTFPVQAILGKGSLQLIIIGLVLVIITFLLSQWFWVFALKRYQSASS